MMDGLEWCYRELGLPNGVGMKEVKNAFRRLALKYHPDKHPDKKDASLRFARIVRAYHTLNKALNKGNYAKGWRSISKSIDELFQEYLSLKMSMGKYDSVKYPDSLLLERLKSDNVYLRREVVKILVSRGSRDTIRRLKEHLQYERDEVIIDYIRRYVERESVL